MQWDVFCRVVDNFGDIGVCWRLAADLASRGESVRLWTDDATALSWMAPDGRPGVTVHAWPDAGSAPPGSDVVVEAFGCDLPASVATHMAITQRPPVWINLEYLSAEAYVERSHKLPSPQQSGAGAGLTKWFFYPGFTEATGGLIRESGLARDREAFDRGDWLARNHIDLKRGERLVSLFCYDNPALPRLLDTLSAQSTLLLLPPGVACPAPARAPVRVHRLPYLSQTQFDRLLWACDINFVRGEDSFVRAQWAGQPFVWHIYPQHDKAHLGKLNAFLDHFPQVEGLRPLWLAWNGAAAWPASMPPSQAWESAASAWRRGLLGQTDLCTQLIRFATEKAAESG